ncbi:hypothetical protein PybrP1_005935 [[Pythium] brassicae (nom. inval.)]|nr:hypothetical protein PybrP1_005935 [[Pythium] brassicae (nom. inval.)]
MKLEFTVINNELVKVAIADFGIFVLMMNDRETSVVLCSEILSAEAVKLVKYDAHEFDEVNFGGLIQMPPEL